MTIQLPFEFTTPTWAPPTHLPENMGKLVALDTETYDPMLKTKGPSFAFGAGYVAGWSYSDELGNVGYLPVGHKYGGNIDKGPVVKWLRHLCSDPTRKLVFANATYDLGWLRAEKIDVKCEIHDVQIMAPLIDENRKWYNLNSLSKTYLNEEKTNDELDRNLRDFGLKDKGAMYMLPPDRVGIYAEQDAVLTRRLAEVFLQRIETEQLSKVYEVERRLIPCMLDMRMRGVRVDLDYAEQLRAKYLAKEKEAIELLRKHTGYRIDQWSAPSCTLALQHDGVEWPLTTKGAPSITQDFLESLKNSESAKLILAARKYQKAAGTFIENAILGHQERGRIHAQFNQLRSDDGGTVTGRFSSSDPNLQQVPARDEELGPEIRGCFLPEEGDQWGACDYSSQEPRLTVYWAAKARVPGGREAAQQYMENPDLDYHQMTADLCGITRKAAKTINLGLAYGMGGGKLCRSLGLPSVMKTITYWDSYVRGEVTKDIEKAGPEGEELLNRYHEAVPFIKGLADVATAQGNKNGYIRTLLGRRCRFTRIVNRYNRESFDATHKALNKLIQSSAADQMKMAMLTLYESGEVPLLTVHDELGFSVKDEAHAKRLSQVMIDAIPLKIDDELFVPNKVDVELGKSWGDSMR